MLVGIAAFVAVLALEPPPSAADPPGDATATCLSAHEQAQLDRKSADLVGARDQLRRCAAETCPALVRQDCTTWLADVVAAIPSLSLFVSLDGASTIPDRLWLDGEVLDPEVLDRQLEVNPGRHVVAAEKDIDGAMVRAETTIIVQPSARGQVVRVELQTQTPQLPEPPPDDPIEPAPPPVDTGRPLRVAGFATLAVAGAAGVAWAATGATGLRDLRRADEQCAPFCDASRVTGIRRRLVAADALAAVTGAAALTAGVLLAVGYRRRARARANLSILLRSGGAFVGIAWRG